MDPQQVIRLLVDFPNRLVVFLAKKKKFGREAHHPSNADSSCYFVPH
jgi:hypothetical protein